MFLVQRKYDLGVGLARELIAFATQAVPDFFISIQLSVDDSVDSTIFIMEWLFAFGI
jgi:hypothetical protein